MGHQSTQKAFFQNGETTVVLLRGRNARSTGLGMMLQKQCNKYYGDSSKKITFSLPSKKKLAKCYDKNNI
jgi:hypothetical protein